MPMTLTEPMISHEATMPGTSASGNPLQLCSFVDVLPRHIDPRGAVR